MGALWFVPIALGLGALVALYAEFRHLLGRLPR